MNPAFCSYSLQFIFSTNTASLLNLLSCTLFHFLHYNPPAHHMRCSHSFYAISIPQFWSFHATLPRFQNESSFNLPVQPLLCLILATRSIYRTVPLSPSRNEESKNILLRSLRNQGLRLSTRNNSQIYDQIASGKAVR